MTTEQILLPAATCFICNKTLAEIGGRRLVAIGGHPELQRALQKAQKAQNGQDLAQRLWICQKCGHRACVACGEPLRMPVAADCLNDDGTITHSPLVPADLGCINLKCENFRDFNNPSQI